MQLLPPAAAATAFLTLILLLLPSAGEAHNITTILAKYKEFSTFNHYLSLTRLATDINNRETITVCAVDEDAMADLLAKQHSIYTIKNILSSHVILDYYGSKKLHQLTNGTALAATMFQATGSAPGATGFVNIMDLKGGKVGFGSQGNGAAIPEATFVKAVEEIPYNISIIHITRVLPSAVAEAPAPVPTETSVTQIMSAHECKLFAEMLRHSAAEQTFEGDIEGGLTIFCPVDDAMRKFIPKYKNLTKDQQESLLEYHGIPVYQTLQSLRSNNGDLNTLATDGPNFGINVQNDGQDVTLKTKINKAKITGTLWNKQPLVILTIDEVLMPKELFKPAPVPTPAPSPSREEDDAESPKPAAGKKRKPTNKSHTESPADAPAGEVADQNADANGVVGFNGGRFVTAGISICCAFLML